MTRGPVKAQANAVAEEHDALKLRPSARRRTWRRLLRHRLGVVGAAVLAVVLLAALLAPWMAPYDPAVQDYTAVLKGPSGAHWFGTDQFGRDVVARLMQGARVSMIVGLLAVGLAATLGSSLGLVSGYFGGWLDEGLMRAMDALYAFPALLLALAITAVLGPGIVNVIVALAIVYTPIFARLARGNTLSVRERDYVVAATSLGARSGRILLGHVWPNITAPIIVQASLSVSFAIITEAALSFLGVGVQPPTASWGAMLRTGYSYMEVAPWLAFFPGAAIFATVLALNVFGDALRDVLDPKGTVRRA